MRCRLKAVIDTDPVFTQVKIDQDPATRAYYQAHDVCFTYGCNLVTKPTAVPLSGIDWKPTVPPVLVDQWLPLDSPGRGYTTIGTWDAKGRDVVIDGQTFSWRKSVKYEALKDLPKRLPGVEMVLAFSGMGEAEPRFVQAGWIVRDALAISRNCWDYRDYIRNSRAIFAKEVNQGMAFSVENETMQQVEDPSSDNENTGSESLPIKQVKKSTKPTLRIIK